MGYGLRLIRAASLETELERPSASPESHCECGQPLLFVSHECATIEVMHSTLFAVLAKVSCR